MERNGGSVGEEVDFYEAEVKVFCFEDGGFPRFIGCVLLCAYLLLNSGEVHAVRLIYSDLSNSYSNCELKDNGNQTTTVWTSIFYKGALDGHSGGEDFIGRGIFIFTYDKNGIPHNDLPTLASNVVMNGFANANKIERGDGYAFYSGDGVWGTEDGFMANIKVTVPNTVLKDWPALSIQAANYTEFFHIAEIRGAVYISSSGSGGSCNVIVDPGTPPPRDINITVTAPDWPLGDLEQGESTTTLSRTDEQLCFSYNAGEVLGEKIFISASNVNAVVNNRYTLKHVSDASQSVPYRLTLDSGSTRIQLPGNDAALSFDESGRTCFVPTFTTEVGKTVKEGDYSDVLTFTVTTKS